MSGRRRFYCVALLTIAFLLYNCEGCARSTSNGGLEDGLDALPVERQDTDYDPGKKNSVPAFEELQKLGYDSTC